MNVWHWIENTAVATVGALATAVVGFFVWTARLGNRVTALEVTMAASDESRRAIHEETMRQLREIRGEAEGVRQALHSSREEALRSFAGYEEVRRMTDKVDELSLAVAKLTPGRPSRSSA